MENSEDPFADIWISNWERQCEVELENEPDLDQAVLSERDLSTQKLWYLFQNSATSVAQLFKGKFMLITVWCSNSAMKFNIFSITDRNQPQVLWLPFQTAAGTITSLYKGKCQDHYFSIKFHYRSTWVSWIQHKEKLLGNLRYLLYS